MTRVLVIDDEKPTLAMFELLLQAMGYEPSVAESGEQGLEIFAQGDFPIVLTDIKMPGIDGLEVLSRIKAMRPETEIIVITGHGDVELALAALNLRATDFIDKPISQSALTTALHRASERLSRSASAAAPAFLRMEGELAVLEITGANSGNMDDVAAQLADAPQLRKLLVAVGEFASLNGAAISGLASILESFKLRHGVAAIACKPLNFRRVFEAAGIAALAQVHETTEQARQALAL
ncbi:response regulator [Fundidesulfovibrio agrisoli]|uniref:response regulator n=1 Tax=Fundidesulfovibrio agrisoli TaxID=2922717 RepID=UPI001FAC8657|nr:response regulator [Fundidesulfovibrio agrisoli]